MNGGDRLTLSADSTFKFSRTVRSLNNKRRRFSSEGRRCFPLGHDTISAAAVFYFGLAERQFFCYRFPFRLSPKSLFLFLFFRKFKSST